MRNPRATKRTQLRRAKTLRSNQTDAEQKLWYQLRGHRFLDLKFKRQKPLGPYVVDFICDEHSLVIELDGGQHAEQQAYDSRRSTYLASRGFKVVRFWNDQVLTQMDAVLENIRLAVGAAALSPTPLPAGGRGESTIRQ